jgi:hypothetical protein
MTTVDEHEGWIEGERRDEETRRRDETTRHWPRGSPRPRPQFRRTGHDESCTPSLLLPLDVSRIVSAVAMPSVRAVQEAGRASRVLCRSDDRKG